MVGRGTQAPLTPEQPNTRGWPSLCLIAVLLLKSLWCWAPSPNSDAQSIPRPRDQRSCFSYPPPPRQVLPINEFSQRLVHIWECGIDLSEPRAQGTDGSGSFPGGMWTRQPALPREQVLLGASAPWTWEGMLPGHGKIMNSLSPSPLFWVSRFGPEMLSSPLSTSPLSASPWLPLEENNTGKLRNTSLLFPVLKTRGKRT